MLNFIVVIVCAAVAVALLAILGCRLWSSKARSKTSDRPHAWLGERPDVGGGRMALGEISRLNQEAQRLETMSRKIANRKNELESDLAQKKNELENLRGRLQESEKACAEYEEETKELCSYAALPQRAVVSGKPGDAFYLAFKIVGEQKVASYADVVRAAPQLCVPKDEDLPKVEAVGLTWAFADRRRGRVVVVDDQAAKDLVGRLFFVGDIHGDADALRRIIEFAFRANAKSVMVFLGDLFDRGEKSLEAVRMLVWAIRKFPGQILWLAGNHDEGLRFDESAGRFASAVSPSEFTDFLNAHSENKEEGLALAQIVRDLPVACVVGNHWISHGGVPQNDVSGMFQSFETMSREMLEDCVWSRMRDVRTKQPNRAHRGAEVGFEDSQKFFAAVRDGTGIEIRHVVCAHQHERTNDVACLQFKKFYKPDVLSCQCIFSFKDEERDVQPCLLVYRGNEAPPEPHTI